MKNIKTLWDDLTAVRPDYTSNRLNISRRKRDDRRNRCFMDVVFERREREERRKSQERRKRWKRVGEWGAEIDSKSYLKGYHVS